MTDKHTTLLIIGAGPFGLAMSAHAKHLGIDHIIVGKPMEFWKMNMPDGMYLRSDCNWHLDPENEHTINKFLELQGPTYTDVEPLSKQFYLSYAQWFTEQKQIDVLPEYIQRLDKETNGYTAITDNGTVINAKFIVVAIGFKYFKFLPKALVKDLPQGSYSHSCDLTDMILMKGKRVLIVGGRQSAFEWAALLHEAGTAVIYLSYLHRTPEFTASDWAWVNPLVDNLAEHPLWFRNLSQVEKDAVGKKMWAEGRLKLEPWLASRVTKASVHLFPSSRVIVCIRLPNGELKLLLDKGQKITADHIILATGYKVNIRNVPFLAEGNILSKLTIKNDFPVLDEYFQTNLPGLFITSMPAAQDFGPFFEFTIAVRVSAKLIGKALMKSISFNQEKE
ncbi:MAG TPA: NAD(P)-binding domain-containing protein [Chitinophagaceae bacterium]|nr:NAD(P)-binding domain-containing protein [Chitinophagaceae bacterium]